MNHEPNHQGGMLVLLPIVADREGTRGGEEERKGT